MLVYGALSMSTAPKKPRSSASNSPPNFTKKHLKIIQTSTENIRASDSIDSLLEGTTKIEPVGLDFSAPTNMDYLSIRGNISFSELSIWRTCAFRHKLKYLDKINGGALDGPSEHTEFGHVIHTALEVFLETRIMPSYDDVKVGLSYAFSELPNVASLKEEEWHGVIEPILSEVPAFMDEMFGKDWKYVASEYPLMEPIEGHNHLFKGFIDGVITATNKKGEEITHLIDWKTAGYFWPVSKKTDPNKTMQLVLYKHFYSQKTGIPLDKIRCAFVILRRSKKPGNCDYVPVSVGPKALSNALESVDSMLGHVKRKIFPKNRQNCRFCPYANTPHCP